MRYDKLLLTRNFARTFEVYPIIFSSLALYKTMYLFILLIIFIKLGVFIVVI